MRYHEGFKKKIGRALFYGLLVSMLSVGLGSVAMMAELVIEARHGLSE